MPGAGFLLVLQVLVEVGQVAVGDPQLVPLREGLENRDRFLAGLHRFLGSADVAEQPRQRAQRVTLRARVADLTVTVERLLLGRQRLVELPDHVARVCAALEQVAPGLEPEAPGEPQGAGVLSSGLARRADLARVVACSGRVPQDRLGVAGCLRVVRGPREVDRLRLRDVRLEGFERAAVEVQPPCGRESFLDREAREHVPEGDAGLVGREHAGGQAGLELVHRVAGEALEEPQLRLRGDDGDGLEQAAGAGLEPGRPGEDGIANGRRDCLSAAGERLGHEEGVPGSLRVEVGGIDPVWLGELADGRRAERREA